MDYLYVGALATTSSFPQGTNNPLAGGNVGQLIVDEFGGPQYAAAYRGNTFIGANQAVVATALAAGLTATNTGGLVLNNPIGNTKNLVLRAVSVGVILAQTNAAVISIGTGYSSTVAIAGTLTAITPSNALVGPGGAASTAGLYSSASITLQATPVIARHICSVSTGALTVQQGLQFYVDLQGGIVLQPGAYANIVSSAAGTASSLFFGFVWTELPI